MMIIRGHVLRQCGLSVLGTPGAAYIAASVVACCVAIWSPSIARADSDEAKPAPRTAVTIGGASVVLVAANDRLYAFVDRIEDNAPIADAQLEIDTAEGGSIAMNKAPITMNKATEGLFVGPLDRKGHMQDAFMVSLRSSAGSGDEPAEIIYSDVPAGAAINPSVGAGSKIEVALVSGSIGALVMVGFMLWLRSGRKHPATPSAGTAHAA